VRSWEEVPAEPSGPGCGTAGGEVGGLSEAGWVWVRLGSFS
jgi:hypothetical protein